METSQLIIALTFILLIIYSNKILGFLCENNFDSAIPIEHEYPVEYPLEPMFENYISIIQAIEEAENVRALNMAYVRILIFEGCYDKAASFTSELIEAYQAKEYILS